MLAMPTPEVMSSEIVVEGTTASISASGPLRRVWPWLFGMIAVLVPLPEAAAQVHWSGSRQYDTETIGLNPSIAVSGTVLVEVENGGSSAGRMYYRIADVIDASNVKARKNGNSFRTPYDPGFDPSVAMSGTTIVEVHNAGTGAGPTWYKIGEVTGPSIDWKRDPDTRIPSTRYDDHGFNPSVALSGTMVVEAHNEAGTGRMLFWIGDIVSTVGGSKIKWRTAAPVFYDNGFNPSVALFGHMVVEVHNAAVPSADGSTAMWYRIGEIDDGGRGGTITWRVIPHTSTNNCTNVTACHYDNGFNPKISVSETAVLEVHNAFLPHGGAHGPLWYNFGEINLLPVSPAIPPSATIEWNGAIAFNENGFNPSVASFIPSFNIFDAVTVITAHSPQDSAGRLWYRIGPLASRLKTITLPPLATHPWFQYQHWNGPLCVARFGTPPSALGPGLNSDPDVGFADQYIDCPEKQEQIHRSSVDWNLDMFDKIDLALLRFNMSSNSQGGGTGRGPPCAATVLGMAITENPLWDFDNAVALPAGCPSAFSIRVDPQVQQWVDKSHPNNGFILAGPRLGFPSDDASDLPTDNDFNGTTYNNFQLEIWYNRLLNRRAPQ